MSRKPDGITSFTNQGIVTNYPNILLMTTEEINDSLNKTHYRSGFPGMNGRSWVRIGNFHDLVSQYLSMKNPVEFKKWLQKNGKMTEEESSICTNALSMKYVQL